MGNKFRNAVMKFSCLERRKRRLDTFEHVLVKYRNMQNDELNFEYIEVKAEIEHKKNVLSLFIVVIALSVLMNAWSKLISFLQKVLEYAGTTGDAGEQVVMISFLIAIIIVVAVTVIILFIFFELSRDIMMLEKKLMLIEYVKAEANE